MLKTAIKAAKEGGKIAKRYFETSLEKREKSDSTIVTKADEEVEAKIIEIIKGKFPEHGIVGEEGGFSESDSAYQWVIDPIDGTLNFVNGIPIFSVSIALAKNNEPVIGVVFNPITSTLFYAEKGKGAFWNDQKISVSDQNATRAMVSMGSSQEIKDKDTIRELFKILPKHVKTVRHLGSAALELCYVARGGTEGFINLGTKKWDYAAGSIILLEAGGKITDLKGNPWEFDEKYFIASNGIIHPELLSAMKEI